MIVNEMKQETSHRRGAEVSALRNGKETLAVEHPMDGIMAEERRTQILQMVCAEGRVPDGETTILESGTTALEIARQIKNKQGLQVITNGVNIAAELLDARGVQTFILGGTVRGESASIIGRSTEGILEEFSADKLFSAGLDANRILA